MAASIILGQCVDSGQGASLSQRARARSTYVIGTSGTGKSTLLEQIAIQDMENGDGLVFLDPHGSSVKRLLGCVPPHRQADALYWDPADPMCRLSLNPFHCPNPREYDTRAGNFLAALGSLREFHEIFDSAPRMKDVLWHLAIAFVVKDGATLVQAPEFLTNWSFRQSFYPALDAEYPQVRAYWEHFDEAPQEQRGLTESSLNKLRRFQITRTMNRLFSHPEPSIDFARVVDEQRIILVNLNRADLTEDNASFIGAFIVFDLLQAALSREPSVQEDGHRFHIIADEFQLYMTTAFPSLIEEVRKFGLDVTVAHQYRSQLLDHRTRGSTTAVGNIVVLRVNPEDARELAPAFQIHIPEPDLPSLRPKNGFCSVSTRPCRRSRT